MDVDSPAPQRPLTRQPSHSSSAPARGILKNRSSSSTQAERPPAAGLAWDEANLSLNDLHRDSTMKITEPKTPYVRYNAETDEVMDLDKIPGFSLGSTSFGPTSPTSSVGTGGAASSRRGSEASEKMVRVERSDSFGAGSSGAIDEGDDDSDDEIADEETLEHRKEFAQKRGRHYSNEAEAMKRAAALLASSADEEEDETEADKAEDERVEANTEANAGATGGGAGGAGGVPPVPPIPNGFRQ
ncbi:hypothetical protein JCM10207_005650 [Rhodosporidiobolus poonsookiae]